MLSLARSIAQQCTREYQPQASLHGEDKQPCEETQLHLHVNQWDINGVDGSSGLVDGFWIISVAC